MCQDTSVTCSHVLHFLYQMVLAYRIVTNYTFRMATTSVQDTDSLTAHEAVGAAVNQGLFLLHKTRRSLASHLGMTGPAVSRKLQGTTGWSVEDLILTAEFLGVDPASLLPRRVEGAPVAGGDEGSEVVPRTGFEPATFCSGVALPAPDEDQVNPINRPTWRLAA